MPIPRLSILVMAAALGGCSLASPAWPGLTGPSELGLALAVSASPDHISQDGASQSVVEVLARDAAGQPIRGLSLRADLSVNGLRADFGALSSRSLSTAGDGRASVVYLAPRPPPPTAIDDNIVTVSITPVGADFASATARSVQIRLVRPVPIVPVARPAVMRPAAAGSRGAWPAV